MSFETTSRYARGVARNRTAFILLMLGTIVAGVSTRGDRAAAQPKSGAAGSTAHLASITIDYPLEDSIFPPEIIPPTFIWRDAAGSATHWRIDISFADGSARLLAESAGKPLPIGEIDQRCVSATNQLPTLTAEQAAAHTWIPTAQVWDAIKQHSVAGPAVVTISGFGAQDSKHAVSTGRVTITTSRDPAGAPIFYRDVPLMPSETEKGIIKPLAPNAIRLIQWRLRDIGKNESRVVLKDMVTCANCHSFSRDGKTMGMDMDGPANDKGLYAIVPVERQMTINTSDMVNWNPAQDPKVSLNRVGFMSQVSPDGKYVVTTVNTADRAPQNNYYVVNFKDYRFLQVFYPTRGILAWYSRETGRREPLPGADDPDYVQADGVWSPDGSYLVFARAKAKEPYPPDGKMAAYANDPIEVQIQYDLYRVPFNGGKGGQAVAIAGASDNGMSNTFPKVSPDGRWIVFVKCRNAQLMRPDSQLWIVPAAGGQARRMRCNTPLMNSWHSFSPNGRWLVFSSKARSPYTQMYLTHIDEQGNDSPAILVENSTAANRAVNLPEFVNIPQDGIVAIATPAVEMYKKFDHAAELGDKGQFEAAIAAWEELLSTNPDDSRIHNNLATALTRTGRYTEAIPEFEKALELNPQYHTIYNNLGRTLLAAGKPDGAIVTFEKGLEYYPESPDLHDHLGLALASKGRFDEAMAEFNKALEIDPNYADAHRNLGRALAMSGHPDQAVPHFERALEINPEFAEAQSELGRLLAVEGQFDQAIPHLQKALAIKPDLVEAHYYLGASLYFSSGRTQEALAQWRAALRVDPNFVPAMNDAAHALAASPNASDRNGEEAVKLAERAVQLSEARNPVYLDTLAAAYAEVGRFADAVATAHKALELASQQPRGQFVEGLNTRIKLYESQRPYRDTMEDAP
ncbi:MAG: tetratricopeptide repeat protein [Terriglobia bacterium]|jgi:tetratricopeptide (TPR) repeat protein